MRGGISLRLVSSNDSCWYFFFYVARPSNSDLDRLIAEFLNHKKLNIQAHARTNTRTNTHTHTV